MSWSSASTFRRLHVTRKGRGHGVGYSVLEAGQTVARTVSVRRRFDRRPSSVAGSGLDGAGRGWKPREGAEQRVDVGRRRLGDRAAEEQSHANSGVDGGDGRSPNSRSTRNDKRGSVPLGRTATCGRRRSRPQTRRSDLCRCTGAETFTSSTGSLLLLARATEDASCA